MTLAKELAKKIKEIHSRLDSQGEIFSKAQLDKHCETFRQRFGPKKLKSIDDITLLEYLYEFGTKDSLVYWLEFKNDEELPSPRFGSIAGGSALKYGLYRRKETGAWMTGTSRSQREISAAGPSQTG